MYYRYYMYILQLLQVLHLLPTFRMASLTVPCSRCMGIPEITSRRECAVGTVRVWHASATASFVTVSPWGSLKARYRRMRDMVTARWNHSISSGLLPMETPPSDSEWICGLMPCFPPIAPRSRSRRARIFFRLAPSMGLGGEAEGYGYGAPDGDEVTGLEETEVAAVTGTVDPPGDVTSATASATYKRMMNRIRQCSLSKH